MDRDEPVVLHVGVMGDQPGGMAQVVNEYLSWRLRRSRTLGVLSTTGRHDPWSWARWLKAFITLLRFRFSKQEVLAVFHLSQRGSFIREGSLMAFSGLIGIPSGIHIHGAEFESFSEKYPWLVRWVCSRARIVFCLTDATRGIVEQLIRGGSARRSPRIVMVRNAVTIPIVSIAKEPIILFCGEVGRRKGADVLLEAWDSLATNHPEWTLIIAGPSTTEAGAFHQPPQTEMLGSVSHERALELQSRAAIAALPSRNEALPMFILESMAHRCAVVGTAVGQVEDVLGEGHGVIVPVGDRVALSQALQALITDSSRREETAEKGFQLVAANYSASALRDELEGLWLELRLSPRQWWGAKS